MPLEALGMPRDGISVSRDSLPLPGPSYWKRSSVSCEHMKPCLPSPRAQPGASHFSEELRWCWGLWGPPAMAAAKTQCPLLPGPFKITEATAKK